MKKIILSFVLFAAVGITTAMASEDVKVSKQVLSAFQTDFNAAKNVKWSQEDEFYKASFTNMEMQVEAYYDELGQLVGSVRRLSIEQLPLAIIHEFNRRFGNAPVLNVTEITNLDGTSYRIWTEKGNKQYKLKANASGEITVLDKKKK